MARERIDEDALRPSGRVLTVVPGLKVQVVQPGTTTAITVYQAETGGATHSWFGTDSRGVVVPFTADPATTGVAIAGAEMWVTTGQTVELRVLEGGVEVSRKRVPLTSPSVESGSVFVTGADATGVSAANTPMQTARDRVQTLAAASPITSGHWLSQGVFVLPPGFFKVTVPESLLTARADSNVVDGITFRGAGAGMTQIIVELPSNGDALLANNDDYGWLTFEGITFIASGSYRPTFMHSTSNGNGQRYRFNDCQWRSATGSSWEYGLYLDGTDTNSEFTFSKCAVKGRYEQAFLSANSDQNLNHSFYDVHVEPDYGTIFDYVKGGNINVHGGSWIYLDTTVPTSGGSHKSQTFFKLGSGGHFTGTPRLVMQGTRIEHRTTNSKLLESSWGTGTIELDSIDDTALYQGVGPVDPATGTNATKPELHETMTFTALSGRFPSIHVHDSLLRGRHRYEYDDNTWQYARKAEYDNNTISEHGNPEDFFNFVNTGSTNTGGAPRIKQDNNVYSLSCLTTTGSISASSADVTLADAGGLALALADAAVKVKVDGAGASGATLSGSVNSVVGSVATLSVSASTTVSGARARIVFPSSYSSRFAAVGETDYNSRGATVGTGKLRYVSLANARGAISTAAIDRYLPKGAVIERVLLAILPSATASHTAAWNYEISLEDGTILATVFAENTDPAQGFFVDEHLILPVEDNKARHVTITPTSAGAELAGIARVYYS